MKVVAVFVVIANVVVMVVVVAVADGVAIKISFMLRPFSWQHVGGEKLVDVFAQICGNGVAQCAWSGNHYICND